MHPPGEGGGVNSQANVNRRSFLQGAVGAAAAGPADPRAVTVRIVAKNTGRPTPARVRLLDRQGNEIVPIGHPQQLAENAQEGDVRFQSRRFAYVDGTFQLSPAAFPVRYQVLKGHEYRIAEGALSAGDAGDGLCTIVLERWSELARRGWRGGDIHIHNIAPRTCHLEMEAEDLDVANILTSDFTTDQKRFEGRIHAASTRDRLIYVSQEFRHDHLGHMCLLNLKQLVEPVMTMQPHHYPLHLDVCDRAHRQGGYVSWAHFPSWPGVECPLDVAMEKLDGLEILSVMEPRDLPIHMRQVVPELVANDGLRLWYRFLNCGFRLTATAGTDKMTTFVTVGANRVYARLDGEFTYENWIAALRRGCTFVTNSPVLSLTVNGHEPGAQLHLDSKRPRTVEIRADVQSQLPYHHLEIVCNGEVIAEATPSGPFHKARIHLTHQLRKSCWIAARAYEDIGRYRSSGLNFSRIHQVSGTILSDHYGTRRPETVFAHTTPVYTYLDGAPIRSWDDAQYYVGYLDNALRWLETEGRFARPSDKQASLDAFRAGRAIYEERARQARR